MTKRSKDNIGGRFNCSAYAAGDLFGAVVANDTGLVEVLYPTARDKQDLLAEVASRYPICGESELTRKAASLLEQYFKGEKVTMLLQVDLTGYSEFQEKVYRAVMAIPYGEVRSYEAIAVGVGHPRAARGVGTAMARNLLPIVIPCHRVVGARGKLGGYSAPGGIETKKRLLVMERGTEIKNV